MYFDARFLWSGPTANYAFLKHGWSGQKILVGGTWSGPAAFCFAKGLGAVQPLNVFNFQQENRYGLFHFGACILMVAAFFIDSKMKRKEPEGNLPLRKKPPRILWLCQWRQLTDGALVWETIDMENKIRQQPIDELAKFWPFDDDEVEEMKRKIRRKVEHGQPQKENVVKCQSCIARN